MTEENNTASEATSNDKACDPSFTRAQFVKRVVKGAALTGGLVAAPKILDKFLVPAAYAGTSTCGPDGTATTNGGAGPDKVLTVPGIGQEVQCTNQTSLLSACVTNNDSSIACPVTPPT
jgi:hypothetical protein